MGDKSDIFDNIQLIFPPIGEAGALICTAKEETIQFEAPPTADPLFSAPETAMQFSCGECTIDWATLANQSTGKDILCEVKIQSLPKVRKPKNLKYPKKKRAYRLLSKWRNRYGLAPGKTIYIPQAKIVAADDSGLQLTAISTPER